MLQKLGKIKVGHFFLREYMQVNALCYWSTSTPHFLVEYVMAEHSHDFKFAETSSKFSKILYILSRPTLRAD